MDVAASVVVCSAACNRKHVKYNKYNDLLRKVLTHKMTKSHKSYTRISPYSKTRINIEVLVRVTIEWE